MILKVLKPSNYARAVPFFFFKNVCLFAGPTAMLKIMLAQSAKAFSHSRAVYMYIFIIHVGSNIFVHPFHSLCHPFDGYLFLCFANLCLSDNLHA